LDIATSPDKKSMFPFLSHAIRLLLLLPLGTATVERSFSTMNRILCSERCRLGPAHVRQLMLLSIEGQHIPDVREIDRGRHGEKSEGLDTLVDEAYSCWMKKPRRV
jgi:hypothetical protein